MPGGGWKAQMPGVPTERFRIAMNGSAMTTGKLTQWTSMSWSATSRKLFSREQPPVVATFGPDGMTGHLDHIAIGGPRMRRFTSARQVPGPGLRRLGHGAVRASTFERWNAKRGRRGLQTWDPTLQYHPQPVPDEDIDLEVDTRMVASRIVAGLQEHRSQRHVLINPGRDVRSWERAVDREPSTISWPSAGTRCTAADGPILKGFERHRHGSPGGSKDHSK